MEGKLILKGIMDSEDAMLAVKAGADAIIISNHGGRQLDGAPLQYQCYLKSLMQLTQKLKFILMEV